MEREFKVIVYAISGKPKRMFYKGDSVKESQLNRSADELVRGGYIEPIESQVETGKQPEKKEPEGGVLFTVVVGGKEIEVREEGDITKKEVAQSLEDLNIEFDTTKNKATLFALLLDHFTA